MSTNDERLKLLREDIQRARAEREAQSTLRTSELAGAGQGRDEATLERHEDIMSQLKTMRELLSEQRESQAQRRDQTEQRHAEEMRWRRDTLGQMSDVQAALASLRDERRADDEQCAEERVRANSEIERAVKEVSRDVAETREQFLSVADELQEDSARRHEELRHILLANASARESVSFSSDQA
ncbi:hypothetical protein EDB84DRAFT_1459381 [Lactarius hengduanensis]|nr:hypothetical protein EDB84DRAFT_1459381 [Lactarius hengduanensis]